MTNKKLPPREKRQAPTNKAVPAAIETKKDRVLALLRREGGATLREVSDLTGWQSHSTRAVFTGLRKKGFGLERVRAEGVTRYAITAEPAA